MVRPGAPHSLVRLSKDRPPQSIVRATTSLSTAGLCTFARSSQRTLPAPLFHVKQWTGGTSPQPTESSADRSAPTYAPRRPVPDWFRIRARTWEDSDVEANPAPCRDSHSAHGSARAQHDQPGRPETSPSAAIQAQGSKVLRGARGVLIGRVPTLPTAALLKLRFCFYSLLFYFHYLYALPLN